VRGLMADAQRFGRTKNFHFPELYELIECGQVVLQPDADERKPETIASRSARGVINLTFGPTSYAALTQEHSQAFRRSPCFKSTEMWNRSNIRLRQLILLIFCISSSILFDGNMLLLRLQSL